MILNRKEKLKWDLIAFLLTTVGAYMVIILSPSLLALNLPDSDSYLNPSAVRTAIYPSFINFFELVELDVINLQILILSLSISSLCTSLFHIKINKFLVLILFLTICLNIYYTSFSKTFLPESIFFSCINFIFSIQLLRNKKSIHYLFLGLLLGLILTIKKIGIIIVGIFIILFFYERFNDKKFKKNLLIIISSIILIFSLENFLFFKDHNKRGSVLVHTVIGKLFIISGNENFNPNNYDPKYKELLNYSGKYFGEVNNFLDSTDNIFLKAELLSDYETIAQYRFLKLDNVKNFHITINHHFRKDMNKILLNMLKYNYKDLLELSFYHYLGMWSVGSKQIFLTDNLLIPPYFDNLKEASCCVGKINNNLIKLVNKLFQLLMYLSIFSMLFILMQKPNIKTMVISCFMVSQLYLIAVSFVNLATLRYLMPVYPIIILQIVLIVDHMYKKFRKNS